MSLTKTEDVHHELAIWSQRVVRGRCAWSRHHLSMQSHTRGYSRSIPGRVRDTFTRASHGRHTAMKYSLLLSTVSDPTPAASSQCSAALTAGEGSHGHGCSLYTKS